MPHFLHCPHVEGGPSASELINSEVEKILVGSHDIIIRTSFFQGCVRFKISFGLVRSVARCNDRITEHQREGDAPREIPPAR